MITQRLNTAPTIRPSKRERNTRLFCSRRRRKMGDAAPRKAAPRFRPASYSAKDRENSPCVEKLDRNPWKTPPIRQKPPFSPSTTGSDISLLRKSAEPRLTCGTRETRNGKE